MTKEHQKANHCHPFIKGKNSNPSKEEGQHKLKKRKKERPFKLNKLSTKIKTEKLAALSSHFCTGWFNCPHEPILEMTAPKCLISWAHHALQSRMQRVMGAPRATLRHIRCLGHQLPGMQIYLQSSLFVLITNYGISHPA